MLPQVLGHNIGHWLRETLVTASDSRAPVPLVCVPCHRDCANDTAANTTGARMAAVAAD